MKYTSVISTTCKQDAIDQCGNFLQYFPYRYAAIVETANGWGWCNGKTKARMNTLARQGCKVYFATRQPSPG